MNSDNEQTPTDMIVNQTVIALIRGWFDERPKWLVLHNDVAQEFMMIESQRLQSESFRETNDREIAWQLNLRRGKDYLLSRVPRGHFEVPIEVEHGCSDRVDQRVDVIEFYLAELYGKHSRSILEQNPHVQWWSAQQILTDAAHPFLSRQRQILQLTEVLNEDHSHG